MSVILTDKIQPRTTGIALTVVGDTNVSGALTCTNFTASGDVSIGGTLTYEDVTNIDSVGLITARTGVRVTAGGVVVTAGVSTFTDDVKVNSTLTASEGINVSAGVGTFAGNVSIADKIIHTGDTNTALRFPAADTITAETGGSERIRIDSSGNVIVNNTTATAGSYTYKLLAADQITSSEQTFGIQYAGTVTYGLNAESNADFTIKKDGTERLRIESGGDIGINTSNPTVKLDISEDGVAFPSPAGSTLLRLRNSGGTATISIDSAANANSVIQFGDTAAASVGTIQYSHVTNHLQFNTNGDGEKMRITSAGRVGIGTNNPASLLDVSATNTTVWPFTVDVSNAYAYSPYPHELQIINQARDTTGAFAGLYFHSGASADGSYISAARIAAIDSGNYKSDLAFGTRDTNFKERLRIAADGKVGINTITPTHLVHIQHATTPRLVVEDTTNNVQAQIGADNTVARIGTVSNHSVSFRVNDTEKASLDSSGVLAINNGSGASHFQITQSSGNTVKFGIVSGSNIELSGTSNNAMYFKTNNTERVRIAGGGSVGIKTTAGLNGALLAIGDGQGSNHPSGAHIKIAPSANTITFLDSSSNTSDTGNIQLWNTVYNNSSAKIELYHPASNTGGMKFYTHDGTNSLSVFQIDNKGVLYNTCRSNGSCNLTLRKTSASDSIDFFQCRSDDNTLRMVINYDGNVKNQNNSYGSTSDEKLKENIVDANSQWADIKAIKVRNFNFKDDSAKTKLLGVVAQEIETVSAGLVSESIDRDPSTGEDLGTKTKSVKYSILYMKAIKALQEAIAKIETLETKVAALESS